MPGTPAAESITVHLDSAARAELDQLARLQSRNPAALVEETVTAYLDLNRRQVARIEEGLWQARAGEFATDAEVETAYAAFR